MKKFIAVVLVVCAVLTYKFYHPAKDRVLRVGMECDYAPNNWEEPRESDSNVPLVNNPGYYAEGYDVQIAKHIAHELDADLEVYKLSWQELIPALNEGRIDAILSGMLDTDSRKEKIAFSVPYELNKTEYTIIVNADSKYANSKKLSDFAGAKILAQKDSNLDFVIDQIPGVIHMPPVVTVAETLQHVVNLDVDGLVINWDTGLSYERTYHNLRMIRFPDNEGFTHNFTGICAGVRKEDTQLLKEINDSIKGLSKRERQKIMDRAISRLWRSL